MIKTKTELLEQKIAEGGILLGTQCDIPCLRTLDIVSDMDYDTIWIDTEHHPIDLESLNMMLFVIAHRKPASIVRVVNNDPSTVKPILDMGVDGIIFPNVKDAEEARQCVAAATYPPDGIRGYAPGRGALMYGKIDNDEYIQHYSKKIWKIIQIEDYHAVDKIDEILDVPGISGLLVGPWDMSGSMGVLNQTDHPELKKRFDYLMERANARGVMVAVACMPHQMPEWLARGAKWINMGADLGFVAMGAAQMHKSMVETVEKFKGEVK